MKTVICASLLCLSLGTLLLSGCGSEPEITYEDKKLEKIARVFWHQDDRYSVLVEVADKTYKIVELERGCTWGNNKVQIIADLKPEDQMWVLGRAKIHTKGGSQWRCFEKLEIHVHSPKEVDGGMWERTGKGSPRTGQTSVIE